MALEKFRRRLRVLHVFVHAQGQGFQSLQELPGGDGLLAAAEIPHDTGAGFGDERKWTEILCVDHVVISVIGVCEILESSAPAPVEFPLIDNDAPNGCA